MQISCIYFWDRPSSFEDKLCKYSGADRNWGSGGLGNRTFIYMLSFGRDYNKVPKLFFKNLIRFDRVMQSKYKLLF